MADLDPVTDEAISVVAGELLARVAAYALDADDHWEDFPEIGEYDWVRVVAAAEQLAAGLEQGMDPFERAYKHLASRAEHVEDV